MDKTNLQLARTKSARQIEVLSVVEKNPDKYSVADLCEMFSVEVATLHRDLRDLREMGFDIHSVKNTLTLLRSMTEKDFRQLLSVYLTSVSGTISFPRNISLTVKQLKGKTLEIFSALVGAIGRREKLVIEYMRLQDSKLLKYTIEPYDIVPAMRDWRLIAKSDGIFKQFIIGSIREVVTTGESFKRAGDYSADNYYSGSFGYFSGSNLFDIVLEFTKSAAERIKNRTWSEDQEIADSDDGTVVLKMKVNSIEEIGSWVLSWGGDVRVVKPVELKKYVLDKARGIIRSNGGK